MISHDAFSGGIGSYQMLDGGGGSGLDAFRERDFGDSFGGFDLGLGFERPSFGFESPLGWDQIKGEFGGLEPTSVDNFYFPDRAIPEKMTDTEATKMASELGFDVGSQALEQAVGAVSSGREPSYPELLALQKAGMGTLEGVNPNNPTQSVEQMIAAQKAGNFAGKVIPSLFSAAVPQLGLALNLAQTAQKVSSGQMSLGQALMGTAANYVSQAIGLPAASVQAALNGDFGTAAQTALMGLAGGKLGEITGLPSAAITSAMSGNLDKAATELVWGKVTQGLASATDLPNVLINAGLKEAGLKDSIGGFFRDAVTGDSGAGFTQTPGFAPPSFGSVFSGTEGVGSRLPFPEQALFTDIVAPTTGSGARPASRAASGTGSDALLAALFGAMGSQEEERQAPVRTSTARGTPESPFGLMYDLRG